MERNRISANEARTLALSLMGYQQAEIGRIEGITDRQVRYRLSKAKRITGLDEVLNRAVVDIHQLVPKAVSVVERYLEGDGVQVGGDLKAALKLLESTGPLHVREDSMIQVKNQTPSLEDSSSLEEHHKSPEEVQEEIYLSAKRVVEYIEMKKKMNVDKVRIHSE